MAAKRVPHALLGARRLRRAGSVPSCASLITVLAATLCSLLLAPVSGCSSPSASSSASASGLDESGPVLREVRGEIINVRDVMITPTAATGTAARGTSSRMGTAAVLGAITGSPAPLVRGVSSVMTDAGRGKLDNHMGEEITVRLKNGDTVVVVQNRSDPPMSPGEIVIVVTTGDGSYSQKVRVVRQVEDNSAPIGARFR